MKELQLHQQGILLNITHETRNDMAKEEWAWTAFPNTQQKLRNINK